MANRECFKFVETFERTGERLKMDFDSRLVINRMSFAGFPEDLWQASKVVTEGALDVGKNREPNEEDYKNYDESHCTHTPSSSDPTLALYGIVRDHGQNKADNEPKHVTEIIRPRRKATNDTYKDW